MATPRSNHHARFQFLVAPIICCLVLGIAMISTADYVYAATEKGPRCSDGVDNDGDGLVDGDDPDCGGGTEPPPVTLEIREAFADQETDTLTLVGGDFSSPVVTFGDAQTELTVSSATTSVITATLPAGLLAGDYAVNVADSGATTSFMLTLGAEGPQGDLPCTAITQLPFVIATEGVYCLVGNLSTAATSGSAITVNVDNVVIDLKGWMLDGLSAGTLTRTSGIYARERFNITVKNGTIRGFYYGVFLHGDPTTSAQGHLVEDIRAIQNTLAGIEVVATDTIVRRNLVLETGGSTVDTNVAAVGIEIFGSGGWVSNNDVINTLASGSGNGTALSFVNAHGSVAESNRIDNVSSGTGWSKGIEIRYSDNVLAVRNNITGVVNGIFYNSSTGKYKDNLTSGVTTPFTGGTDAGGNN